MIYLTYFLVLVAGAMVGVFFMALCPWKIVKPGDPDANEHQSQWQIVGGAYGLTPVGALHAALGAKEFNAYLIAAAPDLLEALELIANPVGVFSRDKETYLNNVISFCIETALAAIKQAKGEDRG